VARAVVPAALPEGFARRVSYARALRPGSYRRRRDGASRPHPLADPQGEPELATLVSRYLLADIRSLQAPYIIPNHLAQADPLIARFERWARENLKEGFSLQEAAGAIATSARTLQRRCEAVLGKSPLSYFQDLRVERAQSLLYGGRLDLDAIAAEVGYVDGATLGALLRERLGRGVRELRADLR
jgi:transcriptional regulator GlxA family with amidase domain